MYFKRNSRHRKKSIQGLRSFKDSLPKDIKDKILKKAGVYSKITNNWKKIVGNDLFKICSPKSFKNINTSGTKLLNIMVKRGHEMDVEYSRKIIIDSINEFLGYEFVNKIKLLNLEDNK